MSHHRLLLRQLRRHLPDWEKQPELASLLEAISQAYAQADQDRSLLERSLDLTSQELIGRYEETRRHLLALRESRVRLQDSLALLHATLDATAEGMLVVDLSGQLRLQNRQLAKLFNLYAPETAGAKALLRALLHQLATPHQVLAELRPLLTDPHTVQQGQLSLRDGRRLAYFTQVQHLEEEVIGRVWSFRDITAEHRQQQQIRYQAEHDSLTGLANRQYFHQRLSEALTTANSRLAVLFIDLDNFKLINDSAGHQVGDELLCRVAARIQQALRADDLLARIGGDEFLILLNPLEAESQAVALANELIQLLHQPMQVGKRNLQIHASIGMALAPRDGQSSSELISRADMAMYHAKSRGRNNAQQFSPQLESQVLRRVDIVEQLQRALPQQELSIVLQPKVDLRNARIKGAEALLRWRTRNGQQISPVDFIPVAEQSGLICQIGDWVLQQGLNWLSQPDVPGHLTLAINLSARQLEDPELAARIRNALQAHQLPGHRLELEVTESLLMENREMAVGFLEEMRALGVRIAIDDFGTGYSSLNYLRWLPIDVLKIDRSFIHDLNKATDARAIVRSIVGIARNLQLEVVAEGIEDPHAAAILIDMGCHQGQGYWYSPPLDGEAFIERLSIPIPRLSLP